MKKSIINILSIVAIIIVIIAALFNSASAQRRVSKAVIIEKTFPCYRIIGNSAFASDQQIKSTDSLKKIGFKPLGVRAGNNTLIVRFIKSVKN